MTEHADDLLAARRQRAGRLKLLMLFGLPIGLMALAWLIYSTGLGLPGKTHNKGLLLAPPVAWELAPEGWSLLIPAAARCTEACQETLALSRQIHIAAGREAPRIGRVLLFADSSEEQSVKWQSAYPGLSVLKGSLPEGASGDLLIVDPQGFIVLAYCLNLDGQQAICADHSGHKGGDVLEDLRFLLKFSRE